MGKNVVGRNGTVTGLRVRELDASELASAVGGQSNGALPSGRHTKGPHAAKPREEREHAAKTREEREHPAKSGFLRWLIGN